MDGGRARLAGQQRHLAERLAGADLVQRARPIEDAQPPADHDVGGVARIAAMEQRLAAGERDPLGVRLDLGEDRRIGGVEQPGEVLGQAGVPERGLHDGAGVALTAAPSRRSCKVWSLLQLWPTRTGCADAPAVGASCGGAAAGALHRERAFAALFRALLPTRAAPKPAISRYRRVAGPATGTSFRARPIGTASGALLAPHRAWAPARRRFQLPGRRWIAWPVGRSTSHERSPAPHLSVPCSPARSSRSAPPRAPRTSRNR